MNLSNMGESFNDVEEELDISPRFNESDEFDIHEMYGEYYSIRDFILTSIVPKYDELATCELYFEDEVGNPAFEYYIKSKVKLPYSKWDEMTSQIIALIYDFCLNSNLVETFKTISIFLVKCNQHSM